MAILDGTKLENLEFFEAHYPIWQVTPAAIGLTAGAVTDLKTKTNDCRAAYSALLAARDAARTATQTFYDKYNIMMAAGRDDIRIIKAYAEAQANPGTVYTAAQIPPPASGGGTGPTPTAPDNFKVLLNPDGSINLTWKAVGDGNTFWMIRRRLSGQTGFTTVGGSGSKSFTDATIPSGTASLEYIVFGQRGTVTGPESNVLSVHFGAAGGPGLTFSTTASNGPVGLAA